MKSYRQLVNENLRKWIGTENSIIDESCGCDGDDEKGNDESSEYDSSKSKKLSTSKNTRKNGKSSTDGERKESSVNEDYRRLNQYGSTYSVTFIFRGMSKTIQMFFPQTGRPLKRDVQSELEKIYPTGKVIYFAPSFKDPTKPLIVIED